MRFTIITGLLLVVIAIAWFSRRVLAAAADEAGRRLGAAYGDRAASRQAVVRAKRARSIAAKHALASRPAAALPSAPAASLPRPNLGPGITLSPGPLSSGRPTAIFVGVDAQQAAATAAPALADAGGAPRILYVTDGGHHLVTTGVAGFTGSLHEQMVAALAEVDANLAMGAATYLAIVLRLPITGDFQNDLNLDLDLLLAPALQGRDVWVTWLAPVDVSSWPAEAYVSGPDGPYDLERALAALSFRFSQPPVPAGEALRLASSDAVAALLALAGAPAGHLVQTMTAATPYDAHVSLLLSGHARQQGRASISADVAADGLGRRAKAAGYAIKYVSADGEVTVDLDELARQWTAYSIQPTPAAHGRSTSTEREDAISSLVRALHEQEPDVAASILIRHGRAWIEAADAPARIQDIHATLTTFGADSQSGVWAYYLTTLERGLRLRDHPATAFAEDQQVHAQAHGVGELFAAEQMEFARLRGEPDEAAQRGGALMQELATADAPEGHPARYARGTALYLVGNLLRSGGLYTEAERWVRAAELVFDPTRPAERTELLHCRYALGVCSAMLGRVLLQPLDRDGESDDVFGLALIRLSNSHAAWLAGDLDGAVAFADEGGAMFDSIGFTRYADRARELRTLLTLWQTLAVRGDAHPAEGDGAPDVVLQLLSDDDANGPVDLSAYRPSRALGLLQFPARLRADGPSRPVLLPTVLHMTSGTPHRRVLPPADSAVAAEQTLRNAMHLPATATVPLLAD